MLGRGAVDVLIGVAQLRAHDRCCYEAAHSRRLLERLRRHRSVSAYSARRVRRLQATHCVCVLSQSGLHGLAIVAPLADFLVLQVSAKAIVCLCLFMDHLPENDRC